MYRIYSYNTDDLACPYCGSWDIAVQAEQMPRGNSDILEVQHLCVCQECNNYVRHPDDMNIEIQNAYRLKKLIPIIAVPMLAVASIPCFLGMVTGGIVFMTLILLIAVGFIGLNGLGLKTSKKTLRKLNEDISAWKK